MSVPASSGASPFVPVRPEWLALDTEAAVEPAVAIIDCHHHLWNRPECPYEADDLLHDLNAGHRVSATVFVECRSRYRAAGERMYRSLGETEFAAQAGDRSDKLAGHKTRLNAGIVGFVDLRLGKDLVESLLLLHLKLSRGRLRGIRNLSATAAEGPLDVAATQPSILMSDAFRAGFAALRPFNLVFDAWMFHTQLRDLVDLARTFPETAIVLNHAGGPTGVGPFSSCPKAAYRLWQDQLERVAACENISLKIGGLGMPHCGFGFHLQATPPSSDELAKAWRPVVEHCIQTFGPSRCMFESNFPVDKASCNYVTLWNAFKKLTRAYPESQRELLFSRTAARLYRLDERFA
jgi:L-fuconolactonase